MTARLKGSPRGPFVDPMDPTVRHFRLVSWKEVFVLTDDGTGRIDDYLELGVLAGRLHELHPSGLGAICIIPANAAPPGSSVRAAMGACLARVAPWLRGYAWVVESGGFGGATCRAVLLGLRMVARPKYPMLVTDDLSEAIAWMLPRLEGGTTRLPELPVALASIELALAGADDAGRLM
jgi:hypothetical protein